MSVTIAKAVVAGLRAWGVTVYESDGAYSRGNGQTSHYQGGIFHHTASNFGRDYKTLYDGRSDLRGPLCNTSGNDDGSVTLVAAHPANHAGASGGWDTAPLPRTSLFNKEVWGHEIVYPGTVPMRDAQYRSACILARVLCNVLGRSMDYMKFHNGTSITGKWDAGYAEGKTYDIRKFRTDALAIKGDDDMPLTQDDLNKISVVVRDWSRSAVETATIDWGNGNVVSVAQQVADNMKALTEVQAAVAEILQQLGQGTGSGAAVMQNMQITGTVDLFPLKGGPGIEPGQT